MKNSIAHLPQLKQKQILQTAQIIKDVVDAEKIVLYGSYARGTYQEDIYSKDGILYEYLSDFDILLVLNEKQIPEYEIIDRVVNKVRYKQPLNLLISYIDHVNEGLERGQYFFTEIIESGVLLYDAGRAPFASPRTLTAQERKEMAEEDYELWFDNASQFLFSAEALLNEAIHNDKNANLVAHQLHQAVESYYATVMLVFSSYKPKIHNLDKYRNQLKNISKEVLDIFPPGTKDRYEIELFDLLKRAYIGGKYKKDFDISYSQAEDIIKRVKLLKALVEKLCKEKIASFI